MASKATSPATNGGGHRKCRSWIESFEEFTADIESALIFRRWCGIAAIAATMERRVVTNTTLGPLYPNMYIVLVGNAGIGKSVPINQAVRILRELEDIKFAPTSLTPAALVDEMEGAKREIICLPDPIISYNSLLLVADELTAFMPEYSPALIAAMTVFYDCTYYGEGRRKHDTPIHIDRPQLNVLAGSTPSNLMRMLPPYAWEQGFTSRVMFIYATSKPSVNIFDLDQIKIPAALVHDLKIMQSLNGQFDRTDEFKAAFHHWRQTKNNITHPRLEHYNSRRAAHLIKLSMVASLDSANDLILKKGDLDKALSWLTEAEAAMPLIFDAGVVSADSRAMDEVVHYISQFPKGVSSHMVINYIRKKITYSAQAIQMLNVMEQSGMIQASQPSRAGVKSYRVRPDNDSPER